jgi:hypothetical protein
MPSRITAARQAEQSHHDQQHWPSLPKAVPGKVIQGK